MQTYQPIEALISINFKENQYKSLIFSTTQGRPLFLVHVYHHMLRARLLQHAGPWTVFRKITSQVRTGPRKSVKIWKISYGWQHCCVCTGDVNKMFTKSFTEHVSIIVHQISKHELVTSVGELQCFDVNFL